jgi:hypothetical protein
MAEVFLQKKNMKRLILFSIFLFVLSFFSFCWIEPVKIEEQPGKIYNFTQVRFNSDKIAYILYTSGEDVMVARYDGEKVQIIKEIGESGMISFTPWMFIDENDIVHIVWAEAVQRISSAYFLRYRTYNGMEFSPITTLIELDIPGNTIHPSTPPKTDNLRMVRDKNGNMFIVFMDATKYKARFVYQYGNEVNMENFPISGKSKFPDIAVDDKYVHVTWQAGLGANNPDGGYTVFWGRRENKVDGQWLPKIDIKEGMDWENSSHWPLITLDKNNNAHFLWQDDGSPRARIIFYKYWDGTRFKPRENVSGLDPKYFSNNSLRVKDENNVFVAGHMREIFSMYAWKINGVWSDFQPVPYVADLKPDAECADVCKDFKVAIMTFASNYSAVYLTTSASYKANQKPVAKFTTDRDVIFWKDTINFDAGPSYDLDGTVHRYLWDFGDGVKSETTTPNVAHQYKKSISFPVSKSIEVKALFTPANISFQKKSVRTLFYKCWGYAVSWQANPKNAEYQIVKYRIFRKAVSMEGDYIGIADLDAAKNSYLDLSIEQSTDYEYVVCAVDAECHVSPFDHFN